MAAGQGDGRRRLDAGAVSPHYLLPLGYEVGYVVGMFTRKLESRPKVHPQAREQAEGCDDRRVNAIIHN